MTADRWDQIKAAQNLLAAAGIAERGGQWDTAEVLTYAGATLVLGCTPGAVA